MGGKNALWGGKVPVTQNLGSMDTNLYSENIDFEAIRVFLDTKGGKRKKIIIVSG